jgi:uncharacterized SAM-binding protein YcdF (DUF218 family)
LFNLCGTKLSDFHELSPRSSYYFGDIARATRQQRNPTTTFATDATITSTASTRFGCKNVDTKILNHSPYFLNKALPHHVFITNDNGRTTLVNATHLKSLISTLYASASLIFLKPFYHFFGSAAERSPCVIPQWPETRKSSR